MTKRIVRLAVVAAAALSVALPASSAQAHQICLWEEPTIGFFLCV
jgi:hypothetical protein